MAEVGLQPPSDEQKDVFALRDYQRFILEKAKERNVIGCLPTGAGKTFIAAHLIRHYLPKAQRENKRIIFVASTVLLVHQQGNYLGDHLPTPVSIVTGDTKPDFWTREEWEDLFQKGPVLSVIDKILFDAIAYGKISWNQILLLVLDECHNATGGHSMKLLMNDYSQHMEGIGKGGGGVRRTGHYDPKNPRYEVEAPLSGPRVLGLTATIIKGNPKPNAQLQIQKQILEFEKLFKSQAVTFPDFSEVARYSTSATVQFSTYSAPSVHPKVIEVGDAFQAILMGLGDQCDRIKGRNPLREFKGTKHPIEKLKDSVIDIVEILNMLGPLCGEFAVRLTIKSLRGRLAMEGHGHGQGQGHGQKAKVNAVMADLISALERVLSNLKDFIKVARGNLHTPKLNLLVDILRKISDKDNFCGLVFCKTRMTAKVLYWYLNEQGKVNEQLSFLKCNFVLGFNQSQKIHADILSATLDKQKKTLQMFRERKLNLLCCTNVLEEGLDVAACNMVIRFDRIETYTSYVQSMGRARKKDATFIVMVGEEALEEERKSVEKHQMINGDITRYLNDRVEHPDNFFDLEENRVPDLELNRLIPLFQPIPNGPRIYASAAIQAVYQYCQTLASDLIRLSPTAWATSPADRCYKAYVQLPTCSVVKDTVEGETFPNKYVAKKSAFMEVVKRLWAAGVLDPSTLRPISRHSITNFRCEFLDQLDKELEKTSPEKSKPVGSKNHFVWYPKQVSQLLHSGSGNLRVYRILISLVEFRGDEETKKLFDFSQQNYVFGIVSSADLAKVPKSPLYSRSCRYTLSLEEVPYSNGLKLTEAQTTALKCFQKTVFLELLGLGNNGLVDKEEIFYFVVPLKTNRDSPSIIAWDIVERLLEENPCAPFSQYSQEIPASIRESFRVNVNSYKDAVVVPYLDSQWKPNEELRDVYSVASILFQESPLSLMRIPGSRKNYVEHYGKKGIRIFNQEQPLLLVKQIGKQLNFLTDTKKEKERVSSSPLMVLVPELLRLFPLPSSLFLQAKLLPSVLHRIERLLLAEELRVGVASQFGWTGRTIQPSFDPDSEPMEDSVEDEAMEVELDIQVIETVNVMLDATSSWALRRTSSSSSEEELNEFLDSDEITAESLSTSGSSGSLSSSEDERTVFLRGLGPLESAPYQGLDPPTDFSLVGGPSTYIVMEALTLLHANDSINLERLEMIGDSLLKFIASAHVFTHFPLMHEGQLTAIRTRLICNKHLFQLGAKKGLPAYLAGCYFYPQGSYLPPGTQLGRNPQKEAGKKPHQEAHTNHTHSLLGDKSVADCVEALIGGYFVSGGIDGALRLMEWVGLKAPTSAKEVSVPYKPLRELPNAIPKYPSGPQGLLASTRELYKILGYEFQNEWLVVEAFTHATFGSNRITGSYQRLEFLGDAVLDFLITNFIYKTGPNIEPGRLTDLRSSLVNNITFGSLVVRLGLHKYILKFSKELDDLVDKFVGYQDKNGHQINGQYITMIGDPDTLIAQDIDVPKVLGDVFESLIGALFLDTGMSLDKVWAVVYRLMKNEIESFSEDIPISPVRKVYERFHSLNTPIKFTYKERKDLNSNLNLNELMNEEDDQETEPWSRVAILEIVVNGETKRFRGLGMNKKCAKQAAAKYAIKTLKF